jgi:beta-lactam-binding protein with PASTA domain
MVPNLINMPRDQAEAKLDALGIGYTVVDVTSSSYQADIGSVAETDPAAGTRLNPGDVVVLKVKKHKPQSDNPPAAPAEPSAPPPPPKP